MSFRSLAHAAPLLCSPLVRPLVSPSSLFCRALRLLRGRARISHLPRRRMKTYRSRVPAARRISRYSGYIGRGPPPPLLYCAARPRRASRSRATRARMQMRVPERHYGYRSLSRWKRRASRDPRRNPFHLPPPLHPPCLFSFMRVVRRGR